MSYDERMLRFLLAIIFALTCVTAADEPPASEQPSEATDTQSAWHVSAMSFNIRYGTANDGPNHWRLRRHMCVEVIEQFEGDFVGLQEALRFQIDQLRDALPRYADTGVGRDDGRRAGEHSSILYDRRRWRLDAREHGTFWLSDTPDQVASRSWGNTIPRIVTWARFIERESDRGIWVYNTHFDHRSQESRANGARLLALRVASRTYPDEPVIVMGDFNMGENNPGVRYLAGEGVINQRRSPVALVDTFRAVHPDETEVGTFNGFRYGLTRGPKIDYIFVDASATVHDATIIRYAVDERYPSDHFPITATLSWPKPQESTEQTDE
jgi:endonuclease/exonuclease/phosphatase family metal-dependent hydrolase